MNFEHADLGLDDRDLQLVFALWSTSTCSELEAVLDPASPAYYEHEMLADEYDVNLSKRDFALDALRASLAYLHRKGFSVERGGRRFSLSNIERDLWIDDDYPVRHD